MRPPDPASIASAADRAEARADRRLGRGRPSSIDMLPPEVEEDKVWALAELAKTDRTQSDILLDLNDRLARKGVDPISSSAFNRQAMRVAVATRRMQDARAMFEGVAGQFTAGDVDENTIVLGEFIKTLIIELVADGGERTPKDAMEIARAFQATVSAQKMSAERRQKLQAEFKEKTEVALDKVAAKTKGLTPELRDELRRDLFGVA